MEPIVIKFARSELKLWPRDEADISVMREIFKLREYRAAESIIKTAREPILDAGAHAGFFSLYCRAFNPQVLIIALEPEANNLKLLGKHLKENKIGDVRVVAGALAGETGERELAISSDSHNHYLSAGSGDGVSVKAFSLSDLCRAQKVKQLSLLKMDIEGAEFEVFANLKSDDYRLFKSVILEYHNNRPNNYKEIETKLRENGFGVQVFPSKFDKSMGFILATNKRCV